MQLTSLMYNTQTNVKIETTNLQTVGQSCSNRFFVCVLRVGEVRTRVYYPIAFLHSQIYNFWGLLISAYE